jgi:hypothetical protein
MPPDPGVCAASRRLLARTMAGRRPRRVASTRRTRRGRPPPPAGRTRGQEHQSAGVPTRRRSLVAPTSTWRVLHARENDTHPKRTQRGDLNRAQAEVFAVPPIPYVAAGGTETPASSRLSDTVHICRSVSPISPARSVRTLNYRSFRQKPRGHPESMGTRIKAGPLQNGQSGRVMADPDAADSSLTARRTLWQRVLLRRLRRMAHRRKGEPLSSADWKAVWEFNDSLGGRMVHRMWRMLPTSLAQEPDPLRHVCRGIASGWDEDAHRRAIRRSARVHIAVRKPRSRGRL